MRFKDQFDAYIDRSSYAMNLVANPFMDDFTAKEIEFYDLPEPYSHDHVKVYLVDPQGRLDDYLNMNYRIASGIKTPILAIDGKVWMSLTPMEIQSAYIPIMESRGVVGTAGLGLGYFPLRAASNPDVDEVHVYEMEPRVIDFFKEAFRNRPEMEKIHIHHGDVRKDALYNKRKKGPSFDFFFMDVYRTLLPDAVIDDIHLFQKKTSTEIYRFWGQEKVILDSLMAHERPEISELERAYFGTWKETPINEEDEGTLPNLYRPSTDEDYRQATLGPLGYL